MEDKEKLKNENEYLRSEVEKNKAIADLLERENRHLHEEVESLHEEIDLMEKTRSKTDNIVHELAESQLRVNELESELSKYKSDFVPKELYEEANKKIESITKERDMANESLKQVSALYDTIGKLVNENEELKEKLKIE